MKRSAIAICLSLILTVTGIVAALPVMVNFASAEIPLQDGYLDDLLANAREDCPSAKLSDFDSIATQLHDHFSDWLIVIMQKNDNWYFASYEYNKSLSFQCWYYIIDGYSGTWNRFVPRYSSNTSNMIYYSRYGFKIVNGVFVAEPYNSTLNYNTNFASDPFFTETGWQYWSPDRSDLNESSRMCYSNSDLFYWDDNTVGLVKYMDSNLNNGSFVPPVIDFNWFKFQLGQRWYVTTYDQSLIANLETGDDTYWVWFIQEFPFDFLETEEYHRLYIYWRDIQVLPGAQNFISQSLTNVGSSGVLAYDITELILNGEFEFLGRSKFYQILDGPSGPSVGNLMAQSNDYIDLVLTPEEKNESQNNAWTIINNYTNNYPSVTIVPEQLAAELAGTNAYTAGTGFWTAPDALVLYADGFNQNYSNYFRYDLSTSGLDPDEFSMLNFSLFNVAFVPGRVDVDYFYLDYWDHTTEPVLNSSLQGDYYTVPQNYINKFYYSNDLYESFDLIIFTRSPYLQNTSEAADSERDYNTGYVGDIERMDSLPEQYRMNMFWIVTRQAVLKSQLYVFCDSQSKLYKLLSDYVSKKDLWDNSFFDWSMSVFWELETINGHLNNIETILGNWTFKEWFEDLSNKLGQIADNTSETQDPMWYESLWNWVRKFTPSDNAFTNGLNAIETGLDNIPDIALPTHYPDYPLLPTFTPTPVPIEGS